MTVPRQDRLINTATHNSDTRSSAAGLFIRSPSLRPTPEDSLLARGHLSEDMDFLSLDSPKYDEPESYTDDEDDLDDRFRLDGGAEEEEDDMRDWPEDGSTSSGRPDEAVHLEGLPRSEQRLEAR